MKRNHFYVFIVLILCTLMFYGQDQYAISNWDDDAYRFFVPAGVHDYFSVFDPTIQPRPVPIKSFSDVIVSQWHFYHNSNGRFIIQSIGYIFCSFMSMNTFVILNTIVFFIFMLLICRLSLPRPYQISHVLLIMCMFWFFMYKGIPFWGNIVCSVNYLWVGMFFLAFCLLYEKCVTDKISVLVKILCFCFAMIVGSLSESFSLGLCGALIVYYIFNYKKLDSNIIILGIGFCIGTAICVFAPGNFIRAAGRAGHLSIGALFQIAETPLIGLMFMSLLFCYFKDKGIFIKFIRDNAILLLAVAFNLLFCLFIAFNGKHQLTCSNILAIILLMRFLLNYYHLKARHLNVFVAIMTIMMLITYIPVVNARKNMYESYYSIINYVKTNRCDTLVCGEKYEECVFHAINNRLMCAYYIYPYDFSKY